MATLANIFNHFIGAGTVTESAARTATRETIDAFKLRPIPNEDVYFYIKRIDNAKVLKQADRRARTGDWRNAALLGAATTALIVALLPSAYGLLAGYQISNLSKEHSRLVNEKARLELEEARLVSTARLQELARVQEFVDPAPANTVYLQPTDKSLALNRAK